MKDDRCLSGAIETADPPSSVSDGARQLERGDATRYVLYTGSCTEKQMQEACTRRDLGGAVVISQLMQLALSAPEASR